MGLLGLQVYAWETKAESCADLEAPDRQHDGKSLFPSACHAWLHLTSLAPDYLRLH